MKICYLDLNFLDCYEDYSYAPIKYGGGRIVAGAFLEKSDDFYVYADERSFTNVRPEKQKQCIVLPWEKRKHIRDGKPLKDVIPNADDFDLFVHHFTNLHLNLDGCRNPKQTLWSIGWSETVNPANTHVIFFDFIHQQPLMSIQHKIHHAVIGPKYEPFQVYKKQDFIFQCTRHTGCFQSLAVAQFALKYRIPAIFAGPIEHGYPLMEHIDGRTTTYLGVIDSETKMKYNKLAKFHTQFQNYPTCLTLSAKEALGCGTPILAMPIGGFQDFIKPGENGYFITKEEDFLQAWQNRDKFDQRKCYDSVQAWSEEKMLSSFQAAFDDIVNNY